MEQKKKSLTDGPNLSQYFANDPPSFFDDLSNINPSNTSQHSILTSAMSLEKSTTAAEQSQTNITSSTFTGSFQPAEYIENNADVEEDLKIPDDVRNFWEPALDNGNNGTVMITTPGIQSPVDMPDVIMEAVVKHLGEAELSKRVMLNADSVTQDERGLRKLIAAGCYRAAVNLTGRLLTVYGQGYGRSGQPAKHSPHSLQLWFTRLSLLAKLGEFGLLQAEAEPFGKLDRVDIFYEYYPEMYDGKKGSIACFSFRLLIAELPLYLGNPKLALDQLSEQCVICSEIRNHFLQRQMPGAAEFWSKREVRVLHSIINCALSMKKYNLIDDIIRDKILDTELSRDERRSLFSAWGRIYLQIGDIFGAEQKFAEARRLREINSVPDLRDLVDKGLITVARNSFPEAFGIFQKALHFESNNTMILNNMGVCLLYAGKLKEAINLFERAISLNPQKSLNESLLVNLCTLYELESNNSKNKKLNLLRLINKYKPDLNISLEIVLKLTN